MPMATLPAIQVQWADVTLGTDVFVAWNVYRGATRIAVLTNRTTRSYTDNTPASGVSYSYGVTVTVSRSGVPLESPVGAVTTAITFTSAFLHDVRNPGTYVELRTTQVSVDDVQTQTSLQPWGSTAPVIYLGQSQAQTLQLRGVAADFSDYSAWRALEVAYQNQRTLGSVFCYRNWWAQDRRFVAITQLQRVDDADWTWSYTLTLQEVTFSEGL